jgi:hypothetical protein
MMRLSLCHMHVEFMARVKVRRSEHGNGVNEMLLAVVAGAVAVAIDDVVALFVAAVKKMERREPSPDRVAT